MNIKNKLLHELKDVVWYFKKIKLFFKMKKVDFSPLTIEDAFDYAEDITTYDYKLMHRMERLQIEIKKVACLSEGLTYWDFVYRYFETFLILSYWSRPVGTTEKEYKDLIQLIFHLQTKIQVFFNTSGNQVSEFKENDKKLSFCNNENDVITHNERIINLKKYLRGI